MLDSDFLSDFNMEEITGSISNLPGLAQRILVQTRFHIPDNFLTAPDTMANLNKTLLILEAAGITDISMLPNIEVGGMLVPQKGITTGRLNNELLGPPCTIPQARFRRWVDDNKLEVVSEQTNARLVNVEKISGIVSLDRPIWVANEIIIEDGTTIILNVENENYYFTIITNKLKVGKNVTITWERPKRCLDPEASEYRPLKPDAPSPPSTPGQDEGLSDGKPGIDGTPGGNIKIDENWGAGHDGPEIELWVLEMTGHIAFDVDGEDGCRGLKGGDGGDGGPGGQGSPEAYDWFIKPICKRGRGSGGNGGRGGNGGNGGRGGNGGNGGRVRIYAPRSVIEKYEKGFHIGAQGGKAGAGGEGGEPGLGGPGGAQGERPYKDIAVYGQEGARVITNGERGPDGKKGTTGPDGNNGNPHSDSHIFLAINSEDFRRKLLSPMIDGRNPGVASPGDNVTITGSRFTQTDNILFIEAGNGGTEYIQGTFMSTNEGREQLTFTVPNIRAGLWKLFVQQIDKTRSNPVTLLVKPSIKGLSNTRLRPGTWATIVGGGFSKHQFSVFINGQLTKSETSNPEFLEFEVVRPNNVKPCPYGETVTITVNFNSGEEVGSLQAKLETFHMVIAGDSAMWGQGLSEPEKYYSLVFNWLSQRHTEMGCYKTVFAHSGAIIGIEPDGREDSYTPQPPLVVDPIQELPTSYPTINQQLNKSELDPESVNLILLNGGINDISVTNILHPFTSEQQIESWCNQYCRVSMLRLLEKVLHRFSNANIVVSGYFPLISEDSKLEFLTLGLAGLGFMVNEVFGAPVGALLGGSEVQKLIRQSKAFYKFSEKALRRAVEEANLKCVGKRRVFFATPDFDKTHALFASNSMLYGLNADASPQDSVATARKIACAAVDPARTDVRTGWICERASVGHPNRYGAQWYADSIINELQKEVAIYSEFKFPDEFFWGVATAAIQVEGIQMENDWAIFANNQVIRKRVQNNGQKVGANIQLAPPGEALLHADTAVFEADLRRAKALGINSYRLSVEWSRIQPNAPSWVANYIEARKSNNNIAMSLALLSEVNPTDSSFDNDALAYYQQIILKILDYGMTPIVTLHHLTLPLWVLRPPVTNNVLISNFPDDADSGYLGSLRGWEEAATIKAFQDFIRTVVTKLPEVQHWITLNEPVGSIMGAGYIAGVWSPGFVLDADKAQKVLLNVIQAHVFAYDLIKGIKPNAKVGFAHAMIAFRPTKSSSLLTSPGANEAATNQLNYIVNEYFLNAVIHGELDVAFHRNSPNNIRVLDISSENWLPKTDFIGINYYRAAYAFRDELFALKTGLIWGGAYHNDLYTHHAEEPDHNLLNDLGWEVYPEGLFKILTHIRTHYQNLPVIITENGMAEEKDHHRSPYILAHVHELKRAVLNGCNINGYFHWSLINNWEWHEAFRKEARFCLFEADDLNGANGKTLRRITESAIIYSTIMRANRLNANIMNRTGAYSENAMGISVPVLTNSTVYAGFLQYLGQNIPVRLVCTMDLQEQITGWLYYEKTHSWVACDCLDWDTSTRLLRFSHQTIPGFDAPPHSFALNFELYATKNSFIGTVKEGLQTGSAKLVRDAVHGLWRAIDGDPEVYALMFNAFEETTTAKIYFGSTLTWKPIEIERANSIVLLQSSGLQGVFDPSQMVLSLSGALLENIQINIRLQKSTDGLPWSPPSNGTFPDDNAALPTNTTKNILLSGASLAAGQFISSINGKYKLFMQHDGNLVVYEHDNLAVWSSATYDSGATICDMQSDGNLVLYTPSGIAMWHAHTYGNPGAYLELQNDGKVVVRKSDGTMIWSSEHYNTGLPLPGSYYAIAVVHSGKCLDIEGVSIEDGARLQQYDRNNGDNQLFSFTTDSEGYYAIKIKHSNKVLDVRGVAQDDGAHIQQYAFNNGSNQQFRLIPWGNGLIQVMARHSGKVLTIENASMENGASVVQYARNSGANQLFRLLP